ncbi:MAG: hypothetical protein L3J17_00790 [Candidatus Jettenia sp.]|nr:MAG: hypothetical protein L3J17_00790 [Candidatus Jettenia sp.]
MSKRNTILTYMQILVVLCVLACNSDRAVNVPLKSAEFPCKGHQCGCKAELDCRERCCCALHENRNNFLNNSEEQKNGFRVFISTINCKYGNEAFTGINFTGKYILEDNVQPIKASFLYFLSHTISIPISEGIVSLPKKPPRYLA